MRAEVLQVNSQETRARALDRAVAALRSGGLMVFPTETVYGVAARADLPSAVAKLRDIKIREASKAFTVHVGALEDVDRFVPVVSPLARRLLRKAWPGPLTVIFPVPDPKAAPIMAQLNGAAESVLYYDGTIGLRCPDHPFATELLRRCEFPVVAASANRAGRPAPVSLDEAMAELGEAVDLAVDSGRSEFAKASTVVRITDGGYEIVREGVYDARTVKRLAMLRILFVCTGNTCRSPMAAGLAQKLIAERLGCQIADLPDRGVAVASAGTAGGFGGATDHAVVVMERHGVDLSGHGSTLLTADLVQQADHVYTMTAAHAETAIRLAPRAVDRVQLLLGDEDVNDPIGGSLEAYEACAAVIEGGLRTRLREVAL